MTDFFKKVLKKIKLFILFWMRIVFVRNNFKVSFLTKLRMNFGGGYLADQYVLYNFKHNDKKDYLSEFDWYRSRYINEPFDTAFNNKVICQEILEQFVRMPKNYFIKNKGIIYGFDSGREFAKENRAVIVATYEDIIARITTNGKLVIKPFALGKGNGVHVLTYEDGKYCIDSTEATKEECIKLLKNKDGYTISEFMKQHSYADDLFDKTANTIRVVTIRDIETHKFKIYFAVQRIGTAATIPVDNGSKGGLVAKIDLDKGTLSEARCLHDLNTYTYHPDSGMPIEGVQIPGWEKLKEEVLALCERLPYMDIIAWDVMITEEGICVIEANTSSGVNILQLWGGQRNGELGDFFRHHNVIK